MAAEVSVGTIVRIELHGRRVRGWVVADHVEPTEGVALRPLAKVTGHGPAPELLDLAAWAAWRWAGRPAHFLRTASPEGAVRRLAAPVRRPPAAVTVRDELAAEALGRDRTVLRLAPSADRYPLVEAAAARGPALVLTATVADAVRLVRRLERSGRRPALLPREWAAAAAGVDVVVGSRAAAWAPCPHVRSIIVLDAHDEAYQGDAAPTWNAWVVAAERGRRAGVPVVLVSPCPTLEQLAWGGLITAPRASERRGWTVLQVLDRRGEDPRAGLFAEPLVPVVRAGGRVVCVLNRRGRAKLLSCDSCTELARCERCDAAVAQDDAGRLVCSRCDLSRPVVCGRCGSQRLRNLRVGVTRAAEELAALAGRAVVEVTGDTATVPDGDLVLGTEAVLHRVDRADAVVFLDFDQELLAPRYRAGEQALALLARASRLVRGREHNGRVLVQTRWPDHPVLMAALHANPDVLVAADRPVRAELGFPPEVALARVSGAGAEEYATGLGAVSSLDVRGPADGAWLVRAPDNAVLADGLAAVPRPAARTRVEVDPLRA